ncbi:MAG: hypothetical protein IKL84_06850 [Clostridia bacterium]|nr:hypothetical protein [Clostridia bacterium]
MKRMLMMLLTLCMAVLVLAGCADGGSGPDETLPPDTTVPETTAPETTEPLPVGIDLSAYTVVRAERPEPGVTQIASEVYNAIAKLAGTNNVSLHDDWVRDAADADNDNFEILVGVTNRPESAAAQEKIGGYLDYVIAVIDNKICISANTEEILQKASAAFIAALSVEDGKTLYKGGDITGTYDYPIKGLSIADKPIEDYSIVVSADATERERVYANTLMEFIRDNTGVILPVIDDSAAETANEILIGQTNRAVSEDLALNENELLVRVDGTKLVLAGSSSFVYRKTADQMLAVLSENKLKVGYEERITAESSSLDGARVMFIGNSFTYYGDCVDIYDENTGVFHKNDFAFNDQGYFHQLCERMGADVTVTALTIGGATLKSDYNRLVKDYPNYYGSGATMDDIYDQDFVILQQAGSNDSSTEEYARKLMELFPPETTFAYFVHHHNVQNSHSNVINTAKKLQKEGNAIYISQGHLIYEVWKGRTAVPGGVLSYNQDSFCVNQPKDSSKDRHHPNYLNGYLLALMVYHAMTGESVVDCPSDFVDDSLRFYKNGATSNYPEILKSEADMKGLKQLVEDYFVKYNP